MMRLEATFLGIRENMLGGREALARLPDGPTLCVQVEPADSDAEVEQKIKDALIIELKDSHSVEIPTALKGKVISAEVDTEGYEKRG
jgi:hypothetical protein